MLRLIVLWSVAVILATILVGCELVVEVPLPEQEPKITLYALAESGSFMDVYVTQSKTMSDTGNMWDYPSLSNVTMDLLKDGQKIETLFYNSFVERYLSGTPIEAGVEYTLVASAPGLDPVEVSTTVPKNLTIENAKIERNARTVDGEVQARITYDFFDPGGEQNTYKLTISVRDSVNGGYRICFFTNDLSITGNADALEGETDVEYCDPVTFSDQLFDGKKKRIEVYVQDAILDSGFAEGITIYHIHLNRDIYLYERSSVLQQQTQGNPFAEPVFVYGYGNVEGGFGIFGAFNVTRQEVDF